MNWNEVVDAYENVDGNLKHKRCGRTIATATLNRETLELLYAHYKECQG